MHPYLSLDEVFYLAGAADPTYPVNYPKTLTDEMLE
jgi:hypothetical protein